MTTARTLAPAAALLALAFSAVPVRARADGLSAPAMSVNDGYASTATLHISATGGSDGAALSATEGMAFEYATYTWANDGSVETGAGVRFHVVPPLQMYAAAGGLIQPLKDPTGGGRLTGGASAQFGDTFFVRPGAAVSFGLYGTHLPPTFFLPMELSLELGYAWPVFSIYARLSGGLDALQKPTSSSFWRFAASLGLMVPIQ